MFITVLHSDMNMYNTHTEEIQTLLVYKWSLQVLQFESSITAKEPDSCVQWLKHW